MNKEKKVVNKQVYPILLAFLCMGFGDAVGPFVSLAKEKFDLTHFESQLIAFFGFIMFFLLSIPMGLVQDRKGKKFVLLLGLVTAMTGLLLPIFGANSYILFLLTVLLLGAGNAILQVAGNPIMRDVSQEGKYARNLVLGQFVKAIGSLGAPVLTIMAAGVFGIDWMQLVFPVFTFLILLTILSVMSLPIEEKKDETTQVASFSSCFKLLGNRYVLMMFLSVFFYVGAEVSMSSGIATFMQSEFGVNLAEWGIASVGFFFIALLVGRLAGAFILNFISADKFFVITCVLSILGILGLFSGVQTVAFISAAVVGLGFANIFPLVFSITVEKLPERTNEISGLLIMAIVGGAIVPLMMGAVADMTSSILIGFFVPLAAVIYIFFVALYNQIKVKA